MRKVCKDSPLRSVPPEIRDTAKKLDANPLQHVAENDATY
jgi:hypothetical protein